MAFSSEVSTGSREENASKQKASVDTGTAAPHHRTHVHEFVRPSRRHEKSFPFGGFGSVRAIDFSF
jgi:hypothetical protein